MRGKFVSYLRVSTRKQDLGIDAQRAAVATYLDGGSWTVLGEFVETESGKNDTNRPQLQAALNLCRLTGATLIIAKLDRLSRDAHFLLGLAKAGVPFLAVDMPAANKLTVGIMALVAEQERDMIVSRTRAGLEAIRQRIAAEGSYRSRAGNVITRLGKPNLTPESRALGVAAAAKANADKSAAFSDQVLPLVLELQGRGLSLRGIARKLTEMGVKTARGGKWSAVQVSALLKRTDQSEAGADPSAP